MATLHVLCGIPGSGKTVFAEKLLREVKAVRLANDDWMIPLFGTNPPEREFRVAVRKIEELQWRLAADLLRVGVDVIWDYGVWSRRDRADLHRQCVEAGARFLLYDVRCDFEVAVRRVLARTASNPARELEINREAMLQFLAKYEEPTAAEGFETRVVEG
jgi:predicted kinase